jgi:hypothetical protein
LKKWVESDLRRIIEALKADVENSENLPLLKKLPVLNLAPLLFLFYATRTSENIRFLGDSIELGYNPKQLGLLKNISSPVDDNLLKPIESSFNFSGTSKDAAFSAILDENFFNYFIVPLIQGDQKISLREILSTNPKMGLFTQLLTTRTIGTVIPQFKEQYKENTQVDVVATLSHESVLEGNENAVPSGFSIDSKGNF